MEELLRSILELGIGAPDIPADDTSPRCVATTDDADTVAAYHDAANDSDDEASGLALTSEQVLVLQQVKVIDHLGGLRVIFPSRVDLQSSGYAVNRDYQ